MPSRAVRHVARAGVEQVVDVDAVARRAGGDVAAEVVAEPRHRRAGGDRAAEDVRVARGRRTRAAC